MEATVIRWGDNLAVRLSTEEAEQLGLTEGQTVEVVAKREPKRERLTVEEKFAEMRRLRPGFESPAVDWGPDRASEIINDDDPR